MTILHKTQNNNYVLLDRDIYLILLGALAGSDPETKIQSTPKANRQKLADAERPPSQPGCFREQAACSSKDPSAYP